jgi:uncharacterized damage-inducible protein DinB
MIDPMLMELEMEAATTRRVLERVPEDKLSWRPHPKSMSLGTLALHIATVPAAIANLCLVDLESPPTFTPPEATSLEEVLVAHEKSQASAREILSKMDDEFLGQTWSMKRDGQPIMAVPRIAFLRSVLFNHGYHHRGQLTVYLRLLDIPVPSVFGPSADENPFV